MTRNDVSFIFDLDGTLVDSVYQHVLAWHEALQAEHIDLSMWRVHRRIGMSGGLATNMLLREVEVAISPELLDRLKTRHGEAYGRLARAVRPLPGALALLEYLTRTEIPWAIATSGNMDVAKYNLDLLGVDPSSVPVVTRNDVKRAKPDPDLFLCRGRPASHGHYDLGHRRRQYLGHACGAARARPWRGRALGRLRPGRAGARGGMRVYEDPADLLRHIDEIGGRA